MTEEIQPLPKNDIKSRIDAFNAISGQYLTTLTKGMKNPIKGIEIIDVATKTGSGTGSIGLWRYYVLVNATREQGKEMVILEVNQQ